MFLSNIKIKKKIKNSKAYFFCTKTFLLCQKINYTSNEIKIHLYLYTNTKIKYECVFMNKNH